MTVRLDGIDLVVFDKDGTIIEFGSMWSGWAVALVEGLVDGHGTADRRAPLRDARGRPGDRGRARPAEGWPRRRWRACAIARARCSWRAA